MSRRISKESQRKISERLEREEEQKKAQKKEMDERELKKLIRQAKMMREAGVRDAVVEKQTRVMKVLTKEKDLLVDSMKVMTSTQRCLTDAKQAQEIANLFAQGDDLDAAIALEKNYIDDLESQIRKDSVNIQSVKKSKGNAVLTSEYMEKKQNERADRTLESWKSRLAAEQTQLALVIKGNEEMKIKLQHYLKEKGQFNKLFGELMAKLTKGKGVMADILERSRQTFQQRDEVYRKIDALRSRDKADLAKQMEEMQELEIKLEDDKALSLFRSRVQKIRENLLSGVQTNVKDSVEQRMLTEKLERANDFMRNVNVITGQTDCEEICKHIVAEDSKLFSLFTFNMEIRDQLEVLTHKTTQLVSAVNEESIAAEDKHHNYVALVREKEKRLEIMENQLNDMRDYYDANARLFGRLLDKVKILCDLMQCNTSVLRDLLGNNTEVTEHNYRLFLGLVETEVISAMNNLTPNFSPLLASRSSHFYSSMKSLKSQRSIYCSKNDDKSATPVKKVLTHHCLECEQRKVKAS